MPKVSIVFYNPHNWRQLRSGLYSIPNNILLQSENGRKEYLFKKGLVSYEWYYQDLLCQTLVEQYGLSFEDEELFRERPLGNDEAVHDWLTHLKTLKRNAIKRREQSVNAWVQGLTLGLYKINTPTDEERDLNERMLWAFNYIFKEYKSIFGPGIVDPLKNEQFRKKWIEHCQKITKLNIETDEDWAKRVYEQALVCQLDREVFSCLNDSFFCTKKLNLRNSSFNELSRLFPRTQGESTEDWFTRLGQIKDDLNDDKIQEMIDQQEAGSITNLPIQEYRVTRIDMPIWVKYAVPTAIMAIGGYLINRWYQKKQIQKKEKKHQDASTRPVEKTMDHL